MLNGLSLFSGIGGIDLALSEWVNPVAYCEIEPYAAGVLFSRMLDGTIPTAPIFPDVAKLTGDILPHIDIICGGSPCQGLSQAGLRRGMADKRSNLFYEQLRLARETKATWIFWENVGGASETDIKEAARAFANAGYSARAGSLQAAEIGAAHQRRRLWVLAHATGKHVVVPSATQAKRRVERETERSEEAIGRNKPIDFEARKAAADRNYREAYGVSQAVDRITCLGNSVVPRCAEEAFKRLMGLDH